MRQLKEVREEVLAVGGLDSLIPLLTSAGRLVQVAPGFAMVPPDLQSVLICDIIRGEPELPGHRELLVDRQAREDPEALGGAAKRVSPDAAAKYAV